ncbi:MAG: acyltransferase [Candidatus Bathyarchaeota archaeon]|nr:acyltransferase [Candidatus Bathyarchaeota archaeon]
MSLLKDIFTLVVRKIYTLDSKLFVSYLRKKGVTVGDGTRFYGNVAIDLTRPCLVEIGSNCNIGENVCILTHGFDWSILREKYGEVLGSSGKVVIEDNVFLGINVTILKGVRIGPYSIIGAGSVVTQNIPPCSVAVGNPCKVVMSLDQYFKKRKEKYINEAKTYAQELYRKTGKVPVIEDFWEEFPIFLKRAGDWGKLPVRAQTGSAFEKFLRSKPVYSSFEDFLIDSGIPKEKMLNTIEGK